MGVRTIEVRSRLNTEDGDTSDEEDQRSNARADLGLRRSSLSRHSIDSVAPYRITSFAVGKFVPDAHGAGVYGAAYSCDGEFIATCGHDSKVTVWTAHDAKRIFNLVGHNSWVTHCCFSPKGDYLVSCAPGEVIVWSVQSRKLFFFLGKVHTGVVNCCDWARWGISTENQNKVSSTPHKRVPRGKLKELSWQEKRARYAATAKHMAQHGGFSGSGLGLIASGANDCTVRLWELPADPRRAPLVRGIIECDSKVLAVAFHPVEPTILVGLYSGLVELYEGFSKKKLSQFYGHADAVLGLCWSGSEEMSDDSPTVFASCSHDQTVAIWSASRMNPTFRLRGHRAPVNSVSFGPENVRLFSCGADSDVMVWDSVRGRLLKRIKSPHHSWCTSIAVSPGGRELYTTSVDPKTSVLKWDADVPTPSCSQLAFHFYDRVVPLQLRFCCIQAYDALPKRVTARGEEVPLFSFAGLSDVADELWMWMRLLAGPGVRRMRRDTATRIKDATDFLRWEWARHKPQRDEAWMLTLLCIQWTRGALVIARHLVSSELPDAVVGAFAALIDGRVQAAWRRSAESWHHWLDHRGLWPREDGILRRSATRGRIWLDSRGLWPRRDGICARWAQQIRDQIIRGSQAVSASAQRWWSVLLSPQPPTCPGDQGAVERDPEVLLACACREAMRTFDLDQDARLNRQEMNELLKTLRTMAPGATPGPVESDEDFARLCRDFHAPDLTGLDEGTLMRFLRFAPREALDRLADSALDYGQVKSPSAANTAHQGLHGRESAIIVQDIESGCGAIEAEEKEEKKEL